MPHILGHHLDRVFENFFRGRPTAVGDLADGVHLHPIAKVARRDLLRGLDQKLASDVRVE
jgi:hypothetical protein